MIHLDTLTPTVKGIIAAAFPTYKGRKVRISLEPGPIDVRSYWSGGSRDYFIFVSLANLAVFPIPAQSAFDPTLPGAGSVEIPPGAVCVKHSIFCGKDLGITIHVRADSASGFLPSKVDLTDNERTVLHYTSTLKSSYAGIPNLRFHEAHEDKGISLDNWNTAKATLINRKLLNKAGAITPTGRNALEA